MTIERVGSAEVLEDERSLEATVRPRRLDEFAGFLEGLRGRATGGFAIGATRYGRLLREKEHVPLDAAALRERGRAEYERLAAELRELARESVVSLAQVSPYPLLALSRGSTSRQLLEAHHL